MLAFNHLGTLGRLGNQMFQYAPLRGIAAKIGYDFGIPPSNFQDMFGVEPKAVFQASRCFSGLADLDHAGLFQSVLTSMIATQRFRVVLFKR